MDPLSFKSPNLELSPSVLGSLNLNTPTSPIEAASSFPRAQTNGPVDSLAGEISEPSLLNQPGASREGILRGRHPLGEHIRALSPLGRSTQQQNRRAQRQNEADRTDALWSEMQATLAEVELSAAGETHFFGPAHSAALEELRKSQIALAQAWARSETAGEVVEHNGVSEKSSQKSPGASITAGNGNDGAEEGEDDAEGDILLARKRREANDRYFARVSKGVVDVVTRLEEVAVAMGKVEKESREIWNESDSMDTESRLF